MPSATFLNLPPEKRERFLRAARAEFARVPYADASINRMIRAAGIPRGSFYMYFANKEELFFYILEVYHDQLAKAASQILGATCSPSLFSCMTVCPPLWGWSI